MKVFVTGGMGFIGSAIVVELLNKGHDVTILARNPSKVPPFQTNPKIKIVEGGLADFDKIEAALPGHDAVVHNALYWGNTPTDMLHNDTRCSVHVFDLAAKSGIKDMIYTSSTAALGEFTEHMHEEQKLKPTGYYGATKAATEAYLLAFGRETSMRCNVVRPGYTIGNPVVPGATIESDKRFKDIVSNAIAGTDISVTKNDGTQFIWHGDLAKIYSAVLESGKNREIYYGLGANFTSWESIAHEAVKLTNSNSKVIVEDKGWGDTPHLFDLSKIERDFGLKFDSTEQITEHLKYLISIMSKQN
jgi:UDP-glucose 4-epimerase